MWLRGHSLADVPARRWDAIAALGVDAVWLMGVWERSPAGLKIALGEPGLVASFAEALGEVREGDVIGSPYCVRRYVVDERFGGRAGLAHARRELAARGMKLILDYVPNHVAPDHPWVDERPGVFVRGADGTIKRGKDPYFPPWPDVIQLNAFSPELREAAAETLIDIGAQCDGLRVDMAMLMVNEVFARTWGLEAPAEEFWPALIARVKWTHPELLLIAEAYWDMEWTLQQQGFDYCYDKRLYDRLVERGDVAGHLVAGLDYQERLVRFIENHDEPRAASVFGPEQARAAAVVMSTLPGARLYHDGQLSGRRKHIPVFLGRAPDEPVDAELRAFYAWLLPRAAGLRGAWRRVDAEPPLVSWAWDDDVVVVNLSDTPAGGLEPWGFNLPFG
ncbi:alpha-amylase family glycosyl hydrolase [Solirubrobacter phytolaccae]|uniref:Alpha-amylase family glycosyl hydrolase n=1 Tax=Solirubrobacter phytolaccae TaxID=1404360 RepID=A0A9X3SAX4_9ACTN|nr:alpha-amylase family glycosyl hydrolase [Solirubrobacter phytolaccae]MDA0184158.1 alpha-amylase family glycosyl hydrolase [Solirubrobacter phytolaccae]